MELLFGGCIVLLLIFLFLRKLFNGNEFDDDHDDTAEKKDPMSRLIDLIGRRSEGRETLVITDEWWGDEVSRLDEKLRPHLFDINEDVRLMKRVSRLEPERELELVITSEGGGIAPSDAIVRMLEEREFTTAQVPYQAYSAATLISLACRRLKMGVYAMLSPFDPQLWFQLPHTKDKQFASAHWIEAAGRDYGGGMDGVSDQMKLAALDAEVYHRDNIATTRRVLGGRYSEPIVEEVVEELCSGKHPHSKPYHRRDLETLGLEVEDLDPEIWEIAEAVEELRESKKTSKKSKKEKIGWF